MYEEMCDGNAALVDPSTGSEYDCGNGRDSCPAGSYCHRVSGVSRCCKEGKHIFRLVKLHGMIKWPTTVVFTLIDHDSATFLARVSVTINFEASTKLIKFFQLKKFCEIWQLFNLPPPNGLLPK